MPRFRKSVARALFISLAASTLLYGCVGGESKSDAEKADESVRKKFGDEGILTAEIVVRAYDQGRLGTREQVEADMEPFFSYPGETPVPKPFDGAGKFVPLTQMNDEQIYALTQWYTTGKVRTTLHDEITAAITEFRRKNPSKKD
jgi:hypothetical protein